MKTEKEIIKEFQMFRKETKTCNAIRLDEVAQFVKSILKTHEIKVNHLAEDIIQMTETIKELNIELSMETKGE